MLLLPALARAQTGDDLLRQADQQLQMKDYGAAAKSLETYLAQHPDDFRAEFNLAYAYSLTGRRSDAIARYTDVLAREPKLTSAHLNLGILLMQEGQAAEAERHLKKVTEDQPANATAAFYLAEALAALNRIPEAGAAYEAALKLKPDARAEFGYAKLLEASDAAAAEQHLRNAVQLDPSMEDARLHLAGLLQARGANSEAAQIYSNYLQKHPENRDMRLRLGELYLKQKQFPDAQQQFETLRAQGDRSLLVAKDLLQAYLGPEPDKTELNANSAKAIDLVKEILAQEANNPEMHLLYGKLRMDRKEYGAAAAEFSQATKLQPESAEAYTNLASALYLSGDYPSAVAALGKISELHEDTAGTYFLRAICLDKLQLRKPALENYQQFLAADGGKHPDQEFQARQRSKLLQREIQKGIGGKPR